MAVYRHVAEQTTQWKYVEVLVGTASAVASSGKGRKQNKVLVSDTDKGPRHQTTSACCISWPSDRWGVWLRLQAHPSRTHPSNPTLVARAIRTNRFARFICD